MSSANRVATPADALAYVEREGIEVIWHWFVDLEGHVKGFAIAPTEFERSLTDGMYFDGSSVSGFNSIEESSLLAKPDLNTFRELPSFNGEPKQVFMFCDLFTPNGDPYDRDPRGVLKRVVKKAQDMGFTSYMGPELEFFIFAKGDGPTLLDHGGYFSGPPQDRGTAIRHTAVRALQNLGIQVEYHHHEVSQSQHEIDLRYNETTIMADSAIVYKYIVKQAADAAGCYASFMPKPIFGVNGSGMHVHQSLFTGSNNAMADPADPHGLSTTAKQYIAGLLKYAQPLCSFWAPTVNSYKRLVPGYEAPVYIAWSQQNRSALVRLPAFVKGKEKSVRCELRCPDPSANPYLAFAGMLAAGLSGIEEKLELEPAQTDNLFHLSELERERRGIRSLPGNLHEALHHTKRSEWVRHSLGENLVENYLTVKYKEFDDYRVQVTDWEINRYYSVL
ncbi:glutamine synthetase [bacterium]|nr:glutamine synthetase [bacterium]